MILTYYIKRVIMKRTILSAMLAICLGTVAPAQTNVYVLNGKEVARFDGSQLVGKKVVSYRMDARPDGKVITHLIETADSAKTEKGTSYISVIPMSGGDTLKLRGAIQGVLDKNTKGPHSPLYVLDGEIFHGTLDSIPAADIKEMRVYKPGSKMATSYGEAGKNGVVKIYTTMYESDILCFIDGRRVTQEEVKNFPTSEIKSVTVLSRGSKAALEWGEEGKTHDIILMKTKVLH